MTIHASSLPLPKHQHLEKQRHTCAAQTFADVAGIRRNSEREYRIYTLYQYRTEAKGTSHRFWAKPEKLLSKFPFPKLANDKLWVFNKPNVLDTKKDYSSKELITLDMQGKFPDELTQQLSQKPELLKSVAEIILSQNFPETLHQDILDAVGLDISATPSGKVITTQRKRDPHFRESILKAYEYQCAVCGFGVRLKHKVLALEAAHIMWHQAGGPDIEINGLALCSTHHKLFDLGAFTINEELRMLVSDEVNGVGANEWLINHHGKSIRAPQKKGFYPSPEYTAWHVNEVFKGGYREV